MRKTLLPPASSWQTHRTSPVAREGSTTRAGWTATDKRCARPAPCARPALLPPWYCHATRRRPRSAPPTQKVPSAPAVAGSDAAGRPADGDSRRRLPSGWGWMGSDGGVSVTSGGLCTRAPPAILETPRAKKKDVALTGSSRSTSDSTRSRKVRIIVPCRVMATGRGVKAGEGRETEGEREEEEGFPAGAEQSMSPVAHGWQCLRPQKRAVAGPRDGADEPAPAAMCRPRLAW